MWQTHTRTNIWTSRAAVAAKNISTNWWLRMAWRSDLQKQHYDVHLITPSSTDERQWIEEIFGSQTTVVCGCICKMMLQTVGVLYLKSDQPVFSTVWHDWFIWSDINWLLSLSIYQKLITKVNSYLQTSFTWSSIIDQCCTPAAEDQYYLRVYTRGVVFFVLMGLLTSKFWFQHLHWSSIQCAVKIISYFVSTLNNTVWTTR